jgi:hypothetical protein
VNAIPLFGHPPARSVRWWMFDVLVTVLAATLPAATTQRSRAAAF